MDTKKYWARAAAMEASFGGDKNEPVYIVSLDNETTGSSAGKISAALRPYAARWIVQGDARLATEAEIAQYHSDLRARTDAINRVELEKKQTVRLETAVSDDQLQRALAVALADRDAKPAAKPTKKPAEISNQKED
jgi:hypothetical protein